MTEQANGSRTRNEGALALPRHTTPTWEVELLISGVAVFAMLQLPGMFDDALFALRPRFDAAWHDPLRMMHVYLKSASVILAATFAIHLLMRAHWIALVGMHSIYPDGVRWDKLRIGPVQREHERARGILDQQAAQPGVVDALAAKPGHDVDEEMVVAVAAVLRERALVGDVVRHQDLVEMAALDEAQDLAHPLAVVGPVRARSGPRRPHAPFRGPAMPQGQAASLHVMADAGSDAP